VLTTDMFAGSSTLPAVVRDVWTSLYAAIPD
jgi:hypothetical protein